MHLFNDALKILYTNSLFGIEVKVININFWQIWYIDFKDTGRLGL